MDKAYILEQLAHLSEKSGLDIGEEILDAVIGFSKFKVYAKGELLAERGEEASFAGIVMSGVVRSYYIDGDGNDFTQYFATEGRICVDEGMMGYGQTVAMWESIEESTVMLFEVTRMKELIFGDERLTRIWIECLESGMRYKIYRESSFLVDNATERYLYFRKKYPELAGRIPQHYIATYLGIKPESLSRIKTTLREG